MVYTRQDIQMRHIKSLLSRGFLPISFDYRLCPEVTLADGPMTDDCDALSWARSELARVHRAFTEIKVSAKRIIAVGWSAGGHLSMTLAYNAPSHGIQPPDAVLAFYCPSNFEDDWWRKPIFPGGVQEASDTTYKLLEGINDRPLAGYKPKTSVGAPMSLLDPRWRIIIHYNWKAQLLPVLIKGLPNEALAAKTVNVDFKNLPIPSTPEIRAVSPFAQIQAGKYKTPTFIIHGDADDLISWTQSRETVAALKAQGVEAELAAPKGAKHAFDLESWGKEDESSTRAWKAVEAGWDFISRFAFW